MFRYIAFVWSVVDAAQVSSAKQLSRRLTENSAHWHCAFDGPGVRVYHTAEPRSPNEAAPLHANNGVVLGTLFDADPDFPQRGVLDTQASARQVASSGRDFIKKGYWGNYVAVLHDANNRRTWVLRGPASSLPCLRVVHNGVQVFFSHMDDCVRLNLCRYSINWEYIGLHALTAAPSEDTGLREIFQLLPGECMEIADGCTSKRVDWDPIEIALTDVIEDVQEAAATLRRTVKACVHAWASCYESIILNLSGGLDSSIMLACLKDAPTRPRITCVTDYSPGANSDEREYARLAVQRTGCSAHIERLRNSSVRLEGMLHPALSAIPQGYIRRVETTRSLAQIAQECEAAAIFSGTGGDQLFFQNTARLCVADFIHRHGFQPGLARITYDSAQLEGMSIWRILRRALSEGLMPKYFDPLAEMLQHQSLVSSDLIDSVLAKHRARSRECRSSSEAAPGIRWRVYALSVLEDYYDPMAYRGDPEQVTPLLCQPLVEVALRIPTYVLMVGGWDRGLARRAFANDLPREIARRRSKGGIEEHLQEILRKNLPFVRELLLDGLLVKQGVLDRAKLAAALSDRPSGAMKGMAEISGHLNTEAWLRTWSEQAQPAAAA